MQIETNGKIVEVRYDAQEEITVAMQHQVKAAVVGVLAKHPAGLLVHVPPSLRQLDVGVGAYWMGVMREHAPGLRAMAAVTGSRPLKLLADSFSRTLDLIGTKVQIKVFDDATAARAWLEQVV